jgi:hypothetical protein
MMESIAGTAMEMSAAQLATSYSTSLTKKVMDTQEQIALEILDQLPQQPQVQAPQPGQYINTYA